MKRHHMHSLFGLASGGVCHAATVTNHAVGSYPTLSPLPLARRFAFCCTFRWITPPGCYPAPSFHEARTFLHVLPKLCTAIVQFSESGLTMPNFEDFFKFCSVQNGFSCYLYAKSLFPKVYHERIYCLNGLFDGPDCAVD